MDWHCALINCPDFPSAANKKKYESLLVINGIKKDPSLDASKYYAN